MSCSYENVNKPIYKLYAESNMPYISPRPKCWIVQSAGDGVQQGIECQRILDPLD